MEGVSALIKRVSVQVFFVCFLFVFLDFFFTIDNCR